MIICNKVFSQSYFNFLNYNTYLHKFHKGRDVLEILSDLVIFLEIWILFKYNSNFEVH